MKLYFYKEEVPNFGDDLNLWLMPKILPNFFDDDESHLVLGIGSILNDRLPYAEKYTVLGSGWGYGKAPEINSNWDVLCVRGKLSCEALQIPDDKGVIDPAYLLQDFFHEKVEKKYEISLIPHAISMDSGDWKEVCENLGIHLIDIRTDDVEAFVNDIKSSKVVLTEAMHGAIVADCFNIPWAGFNAYEHINSTKWNDWLSVFEEETSLYNINGLFRGYGHLNFVDKTKHSIKHLLKSVGIWQEDWDLPLPKKSTQEEINVICQQLQKIIAEDSFRTVSRDKVTAQLNKLKEIIASLNT